MYNEELLNNIIHLCEMASDVCYFHIDEPIKDLIEEYKRMAHVIEVSQKMFKKLNLEICSDGLIFSYLNAIEDLKRNSYAIKI